MSEQISFIGKELFSDKEVAEMERQANVLMEYLKKHRQEAVNDTPLEVGKWHCFDIPFMIMTGNKSTAELYRDMLSAYDWTKCNECLQIGWECKGGDSDG